MNKIQIILISLIILFATVAQAQTIVTKELGARVCVSILKSLID